MPVRWRRKADELQKVSDEDSDEVDQDPVSGATSEISISSPSAEATEDLLPDERAEATMKHEHGDDHQGFARGQGQARACQDALQDEVGGVRALYRTAMPG